MAASAGTMRRVGMRNNAACKMVGFDWQIDNRQHPRCSTRIVKLPSLRTVSEFRTAGWPRSDFDSD